MVLEFVKYTVLECPNTHLKSYCNKIAEVIHDDKLLIHFLQDNLTGFALSWFMTLDNTRVKKWSDLTDAFLRQYKFNIEMASDRTSLIVMEKGNNEIVREYAHRWKNKVLHVHSPLLEKEMVTLFTNTFKSPSYKYLIGSSTRHFYDGIVIDERIEQRVRADRISKPIEKKGFAGRRKDAEVNNIKRYKG
jgi:hypothetical protein